MRSIPSSYLKGSQDNAIILLCIEFDKLLLEKSPLLTNDDLNAFTSLVNDITSILEIHTG